MKAEPKLENSPFLRARRDPAPASPASAVQLDEAALALLRAGGRQLERDAPAAPEVHGEGSLRWRTGTDRKPRLRSDGAALTRMSFTCTVEFKDELNAMLARLPPSRRAEWVQDALRASMRKART